MTSSPAARLFAAAIALGALPIAAQVRPQPASGTGTLTIDKLIDIRHPSNPVWSRDSRAVAFMWERAGVSNLYVVPADGSTKPVALTTDGQPVAGVFWSADSRHGLLHARRHPDAGARPAGAAAGLGRAAGAGTAVRPTAGALVPSRGRPIRGGEAERAGQPPRAGARRNRRARHGGTATPTEIRVRPFPDGGAA